MPFHQIAVPLASIHSCIIRITSDLIYTYAIVLRTPCMQYFFFSHSSFSILHNVGYIFARFQEQDQTDDARCARYRTAIRCQKSSKGRKVAKGTDGVVSGGGEVYMRRMYIDDRVRLEI